MRNATLRAARLAVLVSAGAILTLVLGWQAMLASDTRVREVIGFEENMEAGTVEVVVAETGRRHYESRYDVEESDGGLVQDPSVQMHGLRMHHPIGGTTSCAGHDCFRVVPGKLRVEESHDNGKTYVLAWQNSDVTLESLKDQYGRTPPGLTTESLASRTVAVRLQPDGRYVVFVANGVDGLLYRGTDGRWQRLGTPNNGPGYYYDAAPRLRTDPAPPPYGRIVGVGSFLALIVTGLCRPGAAVNRRLASAFELVAIATLVAITAAVATQMPYIGEYPGFVYAVPMIGWLLVVGLWHSWLLGRPANGTGWGCGR
jgi:hypothetical protein